MRKQQKPASPKESTGAKPKTSLDGSSKKPEKLHDGGNEDESMPKSNTEMEIRVVTLLHPKFLWDLESTSVDCVLLSMKLTDEPSQDIGEASKTSSNTKRMEDNKFSSARESEPGASHPRNEKEEERLNIVSREQWEAIRPRKVFSRPLFPFHKVHINYYDLPFYDRLTKIGIKCVIKKNQEFSLRVTDDIVCNFVVDNLGLIYEGRGWDAEWEPTVFRIDIIGNYSNKFPSDKEFLVCKLLIEEGIRMGKIIHNYWLMSPNPICDRLLQEFFKDSFK